MYNNGGNSVTGERKAIFSVSLEGDGFDPRDLNKDGMVDEAETRETDDAFEDALGRDETSLKKEMGAEGLKEIRRIEKKYDNDPFMLNVKVQDMSDTLILTAFGRTREGAKRK